jgi:hypothetical protein
VYGNDETSAINRRLEVIFGSCHNMSGIVLIEERGPGVCATVSFLAKCPPADARINLWIDSFCSSAEKLHAEVGKKLGCTYLYRANRLTSA